VENKMHNAAAEFSNIDWPDGWFIFERGVVKGPLTTRETFSRKAKEEDASSLMVSRKGFGSWYALNDLASAYLQADRIGVSHSATVKDIELTLSEEINRLKAVESRISDQRHLALSDLETTVRENSVGNLSARKGPVQQKRSLKEPVVLKGQPGQDQDRQDDGVAAGMQNSRATLDSRRTKSPDEVQNQEASAKMSQQPRPRAKKSRSERDRELAYNHMVLAGRLRLGNLNNPWVEAYAKFFAALGLYWGVWYQRAAVAVSFHIDASLIPNSSRLFWRALIPGYHMVLARKLASGIAVMERQNGYQWTSPTKAMWLSLFPPCAIYYMQSAINRHWKLHVKHEGVGEEI
jgi:hypothetical protein